MTPELTEAGYQAGKDVFFGRIKMAHAKDRLAARHGMKERTTAAYVNGFASMMRGHIYTQTLGIAALRYYLANIMIEFGADAVQNAVASLRHHIVYARKTMRNSNHPIIALANEYDTASRPPLNAEEADIEAKAELDRALKLTSQERQALLAIKPDRPAIRSVVRTERVRSGWVIAEVLISANGICQGCAKPAPFTKFSSGEPYLEVHHLVRLADGGDDNVKNAIALCPNCHRQEHFGHKRFSAASI